MNDQEKRDICHDKEAKSKRKRRGKKSQGKEVEINIKDKDVNLADLGIRGSSKKDNDVAWYSKNEALLRDSASFPFGVPLGTRANNHFNANLSQFGGLQAVVSDTAQSIAGVCAVHFIPTIGLSDDTYSAANLAARNIYSFVRHANSGSANYDSPDLMMYLLATDSVFAYYASLVRIYGIMQTYSATNRYLPKALIDAMNVSYEDILMNLPQFRYYINQLALKLGALCVPASMSYIERHIWMNSFVYTDAPSWKAQCYEYVQDVFYKFVEVTDGPGYLGYQSSPFNGTAKATVQSLINYGNELLEPLLASEDIGIMSGDILKAFGRDNLFYVNMIAEDYSVMPGYSAEVLSQIENAVVLGFPTATPIDGQINPRNITQVVTGGKAGALRQHFYFESPGGQNYQALQTQVIALAFNRILNFHKDDPSAGDTIVATRLMNIVTELALDSGSNPTVIYSCEQLGSEIVSQVHLFNINAAGDLIDTPIQRYGLLSGSVTSNTQMAMLATFDWAPILAVVDLSADKTKARLIGYTADFDNYTEISASDIKRMHDTALLSEFDVPQMARLSNRPT